MYSTAKAEDCWYYELHSNRTFTCAAVDEKELGETASWAALSESNRVYFRVIGSNWAHVCDLCALPVQIFVAVRHPANEQPSICIWPMAALSGTSEMRRLTMQMAALSGTGETPTNTSPPVVRIPRTRQSRPDVHERRELTQHM